MKFMINAVRTVAVVCALVGTSSALRAAVADDRPELVIAVNQLPSTLEPAVFDGNNEIRVTHSVFDLLIRRDFLHQAKTGEVRLVPGLATSWKRISPTTLELELRQGVKFHDGSEFTADDVIFSFGKERVYGVKAPSSLRGFSLAISTASRS
jgi:peptide/nickel transport system substrate-binding protein